MSIRDAANNSRSLPLGLGRRGLLPNLYDVIIFILIAAAFVAVAHGIREMDAPLAKLSKTSSSLFPLLPDRRPKSTSGPLLKAL